MKLVFLAGPFRGDGSREAKLQNIDATQVHTKQLIKNQISFYSPHLNLDVAVMNLGGDGSEHAEYAINTQRIFLERCDILAVLPGWQESSGTKDEIDYAESVGMPIVFLEEADAINQLKTLVTA